MIKIGIIVLAIIGICILPVRNFALSAEQVYVKSGQSVYIVYGLDESQKKHVALASGVAVSKDLIATNCHVARDSRFFQVRIEGKDWPADLIFQEQIHDLCLLKVKGTILSPASFRDAKTVRIGEEVFAIGNPHGLEKTISQGIISNKYTLDDAAILQTDATISFGSSGGGLFDNNGKLIGITRAGHRYKDIAFAVPTEWIIDLAEQRQHVFKPLTGHSLKKLGEYGKDNITVYQFDESCFIYMTSKKPDGQQGAMAWFPDHPEKVFLMTLSTDVKRNLRSMLEMGYFRDGHLAKSDRLSVMTQLLMPMGVMMQSFSRNPLATFERSNNIKLRSPHRYYQNQLHVLDFGLLGFSKAYQAYKAECGVTKTMND